MMDTLGEPAIAKAIDQAIHDALASGKLKEIGDSACMTITYLPATPPAVTPR